MGKRPLFAPWHCFATLGMLSACSACSSHTQNDSDLNEKNFYGYYAIKVDHVNQVLGLAAQFRLGSKSGDTVAIGEPASLLALGNKMIQSHDSTSGAGVTFIGTFYKFDQVLSDPPPSKVDFLWTRRDGEQFTNVIEIAPISVQAPKEGDNVKRSGGLSATFTLEPGPSGAETINCYLVTAATVNQNQRSQATGQPSSAAPTTCTIPLADLADIPSGPAKVYVERLQTLPVEQGHDAKGGMIQVRYGSPVINVLLSD